MDLSKWKLFVNEGRQTWKYCDNIPQSNTEKYFLGTNDSEDFKFEKDLPSLHNKDKLNKAISFYSKLQLEDGHWGNDYGGPMFLLPGLIITCFICKYDLKEEQKIQMIRYLTNTQREDGGWGLHIESPSTMFGSALSYVSLRLLGMSINNKILQNGRKWIKQNGGAQGIPSWGKFWLAALGVYEWDGVNPIPPEFWLLPYWLPIHPGKWWCHCRMVYLPMGYIYGKKYSHPLCELTEQLRNELYQNEKYSEINWSKMGNNVCPIDIYTPHSMLVNFEHNVLKLYENWHSSWLRNKACNEVMQQIHAEDRNTKYICIGPVNKTLNMLCVYYELGKDSIEFKKHTERIDDYLWMGKDGMKMQGYNGSQLWDTAFSAQALIHSNAIHDNNDVIQKIYSYLDITQVQEEVPTPNRHYRHVSVGAWPFSTRDHGWPISDCTAEGLKTVLALNNMSEDIFIPNNKISDERIFNAVNVILSLQNKSTGGWATYELQRTGGWLESINPSETFHGIMVDYPYVECTSACIQALCKFKYYYSSHRNEEINKSIANGISYIKKIQRSDGSWKGSWGVCFTYATWFGIEALLAVGDTLENSIYLQNACEFLLQKQNEDGGWGESFHSCVKMEYIDHPCGSQVVNTSWALIALQMANHPNHKAIEKGIDYIFSKQLETGDWEQEGISGVFNANCAISYSGYKNIFPIWATGMFVSKQNN